MTIADKLNNRLSEGGFVQITTHLKSIIYTSKHVKWFSMQKNDLYVQCGQKHNCLSIGGRLLVSIRLGKYINQKDKI